MSKLEIIAQKCKCGTVWCEKCFISKHADKHMDDLRSFDWKRTREVTFTVDPKEFNGDGQAAYQYISSRRLIPGFIRNLTRGKKVYDRELKKWFVQYKPLGITKWMWFLEWHTNGMPHYHLFIETDKQGRSGQIGETRIHHYWQAGKIIHESFIKDESHWNNITGYFRKTGYFTKGKKHQVQLPEWALNITGLKIRRTGASIKHKGEPVAKLPDPLISKDGCIIDKDTGEIKDISNRKKSKETTYRAKFEKCGAQTRIKLTDENTFVFGLFNIPYSEIRKLPGQFKPGSGYSITLKEKEVMKMLDKLDRVYSCAFSELEFNEIGKRLEHWRKTHIKSGGIYEYYKYYD